MIPSWLGIASAAEGVINDPYISSVVQLSHFQDGAGSGPYLNSVSRGTTMTNIVSGGSFTTTSNPKWPSRCLATVSGASGGGCRAASSSDYAFGTADFTVEFWLYPNLLVVENNATRVYFDMRNSSLTAQWVPTLSSGNNNLGALQYVANGATRIGPSNVLAQNTWQHVALSRVSGNTRLFVGGVQLGSTFADSNTYVAGQMSLSVAGNNAGSCTNQYQDLRVTNGVGRYSSNFTPPTAPFPNQ